MVSSLLSGLKWMVGLVFFSSAVFEAPAPRRFGPNSPALLGSDDPPNYLANKLFRTAYHFQPSENWMNDPNAPMYFNGYYHFFYQHNPNEARWIEQMTWGHSISTDLVNWNKLDLALIPSEPFDINGCWSGSATILPGNKPVIVYTGIAEDRRQVQAVAYPKDASDPFLREWVKPVHHNPIIQPFEGIPVDLFRDPSTAWLGRDGLWRLIVGTIIGEDGHAILYKSKDFVEWVRAENSLYNTSGSGMWECVDFYPLEVPGTDQKKYVVKVSMFVPFLMDQYVIGTYDEERDVFMPDKHSYSYDRTTWPRFDYGHIYASKTFFDDAKQRRIMWSWTNESDSVADDLAKGWAGIMTVPRVLSLTTDGKQLLQWPVEEIESLRRDPVHKQNIELKNRNKMEIQGIDASQADVEIEFELPSLSLAGTEPVEANWIIDPPKPCRDMSPDDVGAFGLWVLASEKLEERTAVYFRVFKDKGNYAVLMCVDQRSSSLNSNLYKPASGGFVDIDIAKDGKISLRTLIDHSVVESFGGGGKTVITSRVYPTLLPRGNTHLFVFNNANETINISNLNAWSMNKAVIS